ncbi:MAG: riboflavin synthase [SAR324 cluster bacterium]|nr:riboflavin synthase [SAR324 cluster bacterium]
MFTGIVEELGEVRALSQSGSGSQLTLRGELVCQGTGLGDSIAVNGVCLTVTSQDGDLLSFGVAPETLSRSNLGDLKAGDKVNLERSLTPQSRMGGHFVQGHVDGTGRLAGRQPDGDSLRVRVEASPELLHYMVPKGYIAVDGTSLTLIDVLEDSFTFMLVAYTQQNIVLPGRPLGSKLNLEVDILAKYAEKFMPSGR